MDGLTLPAAEWRELYDEKLAFALMSPLTRDDVRRRAESEAVATRAKMYDVARKVLAGRPGAVAPERAAPRQTKVTSRSSRATGVAPVSSRSKT